MSYDIRFGVKVENMSGYIATIDQPEYSSPTYNLRELFVQSMGWHYKQGVWYNCLEVMPKITKGIDELFTHPRFYKQYEASNGWGTVESAYKSLKSIVEKIGEITGGDGWNEIPLDCLWIIW